MVVHLMLRLDTAYMHAKFDHCSCSAHKNLNGSRDLTMSLTGTVCHPWPSTCYDQPIYQIWSLYLYQLRRYERWYKIMKTGWLAQPSTTPAPTATGRLGGFPFWLRPSQPGCRLSDAPSSAVLVASPLHTVIWLTEISFAHCLIQNVYFLLDVSTGVKAVSYTHLTLPTILRV